MILWRKKELKYILEAEKYTNFKDFRVRVLDKAVNEINKYTDTIVGYETRSKGRKVVSIVFKINLKKPMERYSSYLKTVNAINRNEGQIEGQTSIFDKGVDDFE